MSDLLFKVANIFYVVAFVLYFIDTFYKMVSYKKILLIFGILIHTIAFIFRTFEFWVIPENKYYLPINSFYGSLFILEYIIMLVILFIDLKYRFSTVVPFVMPLGILAGVVTFFLEDKGLGGLVPALRSYWINIHPVVLFISYSFFTVSFLTGIIYLITINKLKNKKSIIFALPPLVDLEKLQYKFVVFGYPLLSIGIILGGIWAFKSWGRFWGWDAKETWSFITWLVYTIYLHARTMKNLKNTFTVYINFLGYACVLFTYIGVNFLSQLHGYLSN